MKLSLDPKAMLQEVRSSRRLQVALGGLPVLVWLLWPEPSAGPPRRTPRAAAGALGEAQTRELRKLPDLARLDRAGELPPDARLFRDPFLFEGPPPPPPPPHPPPPPPTPEQLAAQALREARAREEAGRPRLRYLGYLGSAGSGRLGAFMNGEEPVLLRAGDSVKPGWRLVKLTEIGAEFQNLAFPDLRHRIDAADAQAPPAKRPTNQY